MSEDRALVLPPAFLKRMKQLLADEFDDFLACYQKEPYRGLRLNPLKSGREEIFDRFSHPRNLLSEHFHLSPVEWEELGFYYGTEDTPGNSPYHDAGVYYIQEPSAMYPVTRLAVDDSGLRILDLCAAPGGKSTQIASYMNGQGILFANEIHPARVKILSENIERMGIRNALVLNETPDRLAERFPCYFDRILVDAPCSGEGMFLKNEEAVSEWSPGNVERCAGRQADILERAAEMLCFGGRLVYSTCTFSLEENEGVIEGLLKKHPEMELLEETRLYPHKLRGEGHFAAVLEKKTGLSVSGKGAEGGAQKTERLKDHPELISFFRMEFRMPESFLGPLEKGRLLCFGSRLFAVPEGTPELSGLKVLRPGLLLGENKKNRFEPSFALALALRPQEVNHRALLPLYDKTDPEAPMRITGYLKGLTFSWPGENGYYLICADGYSLGFGKLVNGTMKNHYPKGLRKQ